VRAKPVVFLVTCQAIPDLDEEDAPLVAALAERGVEARPVIWDDPTVDWSEADLSVLRSPRDYARRREQFVAWARSVPRLLNPAEVVAWNTDKHYLEDLRARDVPVLATQWFEPEARLSKQRIHTRFPAGGEFVIKPAVSGGAQDSGRYTANEADARRLAILHAARLLNEGRAVMVQRYQPSVDVIGERSLVFIEGEFVYAVHKAAMLHGPSQGPEETHIERIDRVTASGAELAAAERVHEVVHQIMRERGGDSFDGLLYSRIDLVNDEEGRPTVMEVALTDPSLHFSHYPGALEAFALAIHQRLVT
jgi:hypothetical protein